MTVVCAYKFALDPNATAETALYGHCGGPRPRRPTWRPDSRAGASRNRGSVPARRSVSRCSNARGASGSARFSTGTIRLDGRTHVVLPVLGRVKTHESTRKLARRIEAGTARILSATIKRERGRWLVVLTCEPGVDPAAARVPVADARRDGLHKLTSGLACTYGEIGVEDLNVAGMLRNRKLSRAIADCGFGMLLRQLRYKTDWRGTVLAASGRWYPSSKTCSGCQAVKTKLSLSERTFVCECCDLVLDRDLNAALNLAAQGTFRR